MTLDQLKNGQIALITGFKSDDDTTSRLAELGLIEGQSVNFIKRAPLGDPLEVRVMNYNLCIRKKDASEIYCELVK